MRRGVFLFAVGAIAVADAAWVETSPAVLLVSPVNATWAADHASYWLDKGFRGFLLSGIQDDLEADLWALDGDANSTGTADLLLQEVAAANARLAEAGLDRNFAAVSIAPERPYFADSGIRDRVVNHFVDLAMFCKLAGLRGIAIDTKPSSLFYDYRWDGYDFSSTSRLEPADILKGAQTFGKRIARAILAEFPEAELLLISDGGGRECGPLWTALFEGFLEGVDTTRGATSVHLLTRETCSKTAPSDIIQTADTIRRTLRLVLSERGWGRWEKHGALALGVSPLGYRQTPEGPETVARYPIAAYRLQLAMAKLYSDTYVWVEAGPTVENFDAYTVRTPLDELARVRPYNVHGIPSYVLSGTEGAALVLWNGVSEPILTLDRQTPVPITNLESGAQGDLEAVNGKVVVGPLAFPAMIGALPVNDWVLPASIWFEPRDPATPGRNQYPVRFGFAARTQFAISGTLSALAPEGFSLKPASITIDLQPGDAVEVDGVLKGAFVLGETPAVDLILSLPGCAPITRTFSCPVAPGLRWKTALDGPVAGGFRVAELDGDDSSEIVVCSQAGEVAVFNANGEAIWKRRFATRFACMPIAQRNESGKALIAALDYTGRLYAFQWNGQTAWEEDFDAAPCPGGLVLAHLGRDPNSEILVALTDGRVVALKNDGKELWRSQGEPGRRYILAGRCPGEAHDRVFVIPAASPGTIECLDHEGKRKWRSLMDEPAACLPILADLNGDGFPEIVVANAGGTIQILDSATGTVLARRKTGTKVAGLAAGDLSSSDGNEILVGTAKKLLCLSQDLNVLWTADIHVAAAPVLQTPRAELVLGDPRKPRILVPTIEGTLACLDSDGKLLWRDTRSPVALTVPPAVADLDGDGRLECLFAAADRVLCAIDLDEPSR